MHKRNQGTRRSGLRYIFYRVYSFIRFAKRRFLRLTPRLRYSILGCAGLFIALLIALPAFTKKNEENSIAEPYTSGTEEQMLLSFLESTPEPKFFDATQLNEDLAEQEEEDKPIELYQGCEDSELVTELQQRLMDLGYLDIDEPTLHFGPATEYAVILFQRQHGLDMDGWAGPLTLGMIHSSEAKKYTLLEGTSGTDVDNFQRQLKDLGYLSKVTGYYGTETIEAVKAFQRENKLSVDGKAGEKTFDLINSDRAKESPALAKQARRKANIDKMIETAKKQVGKKYVLGNTGPNSYDCSGLVYYCLKTAGSNRRRLNAAGYSGVSDWEKITSYSKLQKGDLLFFYNDAKTKIGHVGIYIGGGMMVDASSSNGKVVRRSATTSYWKNHFVVARRPW